LIQILDTGLQKKLSELEITELNHIQIFCNVPTCISRYVFDTFHLIKSGKTSSQHDSYLFFKDNVTTLIYSGELHVVKATAENVKHVVLLRLNSIAGTGNSVKFLPRNCRARLPQILLDYLCN
jgi:hypothetical protein